MTVVNINVTDRAGQAWSNGTVSAQLQSAFGSHLNVPPVTATLDSAGNAVLTLSSTLAFNPPGSGWFITACPAATSPCFARVYTIAGSEQFLTIVPPAIKINLESTRAVTLPIHATAYNSSEIVGAQIGSIYYDLTAQSLMVLQALPDTWVAVGGGGSNFATVEFVENLVANPGAFQSIAGIPTDHAGVPVEVNGRGGSGNVGDSTLDAGAPGRGGFYRVSFYLVVTTPSATDTLQVTLAYNDETGPNTQVLPVTPQSTSALHARISGVFIANSVDGNIQLNVSSHDSTAVYSIDLRTDFF